MPAMTLQELVANAKSNTDLDRLDGTIAYDTANWSGGTRARLRPQGVVPCAGQR
jgi:hypothetical protein